MPPRPTGSSGLSSAPIRSPISSSRSTPSAIAIRRSVPKRLMASGIEPRVGFSKSSAGPPARTTRCDDLADLQVRVDGHLDAAQLPVALQPRQEVAQVVIGHPASIRPGFRSVLGGPRPVRA